MTDVRSDPKPVNFDRPMTTPLTKNPTIVDQMSKVLEQVEQAERLLKSIVQTLDVIKKTLGG